MQGEQALERHEHKKSYENNLQAKGIHWDSSLGANTTAVNKRSIGRGVSPITINLNCVEIDENAVFSFVPIPFTAAITASETPAAMIPYGVNACARWRAAVAGRAAWVLARRPSAGPSPCAATLVSQSVSSVCILVREPFVVESSFGESFPIYPWRPSAR